jgi:hypothetical protein
MSYEEYNRRSRFTIVPDSDYETTSELLRYKNARAIRRRRRAERFWTIVHLTVLIVLAFILLIVAFGRADAACVPVGGNIYYGDCRAPKVDPALDFGGPAPRNCMPMVAPGFWQGECAIEGLRGWRVLPRPAAGPPIAARGRAR